MPSVEDAWQMYSDSLCGIYPLASSDALFNQCEAEFIRDNPTFEGIYSNTINGDGSLMVSAVLSFINTTRNLSRCLF